MIHFITINSNPIPPLIPHSLLSTRKITVKQAQNREKTHHLPWRPGDGLRLLKTKWPQAEHAEHALSLPSEAIRQELVSIAIQGGAP